MIPRVLEPEAMDSPEEVIEYDAMDHSQVNARFVGDFLCAHGPNRGGEFLDVGTGTARIPIALAQADPQARILAVDISPNMLARAEANIARAGLEDRIRCLLGDIKHLHQAVGRAQFEAVISNTIIHHIPEPSEALRAMIERTAPDGTLLVRDLARPASLSDLDRLVLIYAGHETPRARDLFAASLHAALTLDEVRQIVWTLGLPIDRVTMSSDRHWTLKWKAE
jgi:ubiquinone/menaquinone biosynthesis C-methylase UbiE